MAYVSRYGPDAGGGYFTMLEVDTLNAGHYASGGDVMGMRQSLNGGNSWYGNNRGLVTTVGDAYTRAICISQRTTTSGLVLWGNGGLSKGSAGSGSWGYTEMGDSVYNVIAGTKGVAGFGNNNYSGTRGPATYARRPCGELIRSSMAAPGTSGAEFFFGINSTGLYRLENSGTNAAQMSNFTYLKTLADFTSTTQLWVSMCVFDVNHIIVVTHNIRAGINSTVDGTVAKTEIYMLNNPTGSTLSTATASQIQITKLVLPSGVDCVYSVKKGLDGHFYAAAAYDGVYEVALSGNDLTWTPITLATGSPTTDICVSSVDADASRTLWIGQTGGTTAGSFFNSSSGTPSGHGIVRGTLSSGKWTYDFPVTNSSAHGSVFQSGDGTTATGATWYLWGNGPDILDGAYDSAIVRVDPFNASKVSSTGRSGTWQTRNAGTAWYPAMNGQNGGEMDAVRVSKATGGLSNAGNLTSTGNFDWDEVTTTDSWLTCTRVIGGNVATGTAWNGGAMGTQAAPFVGLDGAKYVYTPPTTSSPAKMTKQVGTGTPTEISDANFYGMCATADQMAVFADGTVVIAMFGGLAILDPTAPPIKPDINLISPASASVGDTVTLTGLRFTGAIGVTVNGQNCPTYSVVTSTSITFTVPAGAQTGIVRVTTPDGSGVSATNLTVNAGPGTGPTISSINPTHGPVGTTVTVTGTNLSSPTAADVNGATASFAPVNSTTVTVVVPTGATTGPIHVSTSNGTATSGTYTVDAGPPATGQWNDGKLHRACTLDYFGAIDTQAHANLLAGLCDVIVGWARLDLATDNFNKFGAGMRATNPDILILGYMKSNVLNGKDPTSMPEAYYAHTAGGTRIVSGSASLPTMQPDGSATFSDARGFVSHTYGDWKAGDCWAAVDNYNATYPTVVSGVMLDSMYTSSFQGPPVNPATGVAYTKPQWVALLRSAIADKVTAARATGVVYANGLQGASSFYATNSSTAISSDGLCDHVDGAIAESWLRANYDAFGVWPTLTGSGSWENRVQMMIDADTVHNCAIWCIVNIGNHTSDPNPPAGWVPYTTAQLDQWKRFSYCTFMLGERGRALYEFVSDVTTNPWDETHAYWTQDLGTPSSNPATVGAMIVTAGLYSRSYANGRVWANPTAAGINTVTDRKYKDPVSGASIPLGTTITVNAHDGLLLMVDGSTPVDTDAPVVSFFNPPQDGENFQTTSLEFVVIATDSDGIASVTATLDGGEANTMTADPAIANSYTFTFTGLQPGAHTVKVVATDAFPTTPLSTSASRSFNILAPPPPNTAPVVNVTEPGSVIILPATCLVSAQVTDVDGIASVTVSLDSGTPQNMVLTGGSYQLDLGQLAEGSHSLVVKATDMNTSPLSTTVTKTVLVTSNGSDGTGGTGGTGSPLVISTDVGDIELRIKERGIG